MSGTNPMSFPESLPPTKDVHTPQVMRRGQVVSTQEGDQLVVRGEIGSGSFGTVLLCDDAAQQHGGVAVKVLQKGKGKGKDQISKGKTEEEILREVEHPNIVKVHSSWETSEGFHLAMEYAGRGDAFDIVDFYNGGCPEPLAGKVAVGLFSALAHIHTKGVVHRDVKPENIFVKDDGDVVLGDFGLAGKKTEEELLRTPCGTITYRAPEIVRGDKYGPAVDVWSAGLTIYTLLTGYDPWATHGMDKMSPAAVARKILAGQLNKFPSHVSNAAKNFVRSCVCVDPKKRLTAEQALKHPWMRVSSVFVEEDMPAVMAKSSARAL